ncbi:translation initiation factor IF-2-like isoform X1 [Canis lupus familiaris]|uniref:translation initiation factor IF-2-like isoform X1 n=1 Tax=Canis lupus familiaris TaxID=9615 RepID=UPI0018F7D24F|nr:translation initiation factor IF-2-like isoform X1 [Canis lupus familiaris]
MPSLSSRGSPRPPPPPAWPHVHAGQPSWSGAERGALGHAGSERARRGSLGGASSGPVLSPSSTFSALGSEVPELPVGRPDVLQLLGTCSRDAAPREAADPCPAGGRARARARGAGACAAPGGGGTSSHNRATGLKARKRRNLRGGRGGGGTECTNIFYLLSPTSRKVWAKGCVQLRGVSHISVIFQMQRHAVHPAARCCTHSPPLGRCEGQASSLSRRGTDPWGSPGLRDLRQVTCANLNFLLCERSL